MSNSKIDQNFHENDQEVSEHHTKLIDAVEKLDKGQRVKKAERTEPSLQVSEYHLVKSGVTDKDTVNIKDLVKSLGKKKNQNNINKKLRYIQQKTKLLPKPLEKPAAERIKRIVGYDNVKKDLSKWNGIISRNRTADQLFFPLKPIAKVKDFNASKIPEFLKGFKTKSDLMKKFEEVDPSLLYPPAKEEVKDNTYKMTMEELIIRRKETARLRAQQSYQEAKAHRHRKIKSKKFHRIQKKNRIKQQLKEFEELKNTNPEEALAKLEQLDKTRAEERMSLRHKNTGQWAKNQQIRAKYNKETRQVLADQLAVSRELTQKLMRTDSDDEDEEEEDKDEDGTILEKEGNIKIETEIDEFINNYRKFRDENHEKTEKKKEEENIEISNKVQKINSQSPIVSKKKKATSNNKDQCKATNVKKSDGILQKNASDAKEGNTDPLILTLSSADATKSQKEKEDFIEEKQKHKKNSKLQKVKNKLKKDKRNTKKQEEEEKDNEDDFSNLEFANSKQKPILDCPLEETTSRENAQTDKDLTSLKTVTYSKEQEASNIHEAEIDPQKYLNVKRKYIKTQAPDIVTGDGENSEDEDERKKIISEAFADDDVVEEFRKEQVEENEKLQPQTIDLSLPGWGSWTGPNIKKSKERRKKKRFILNVPKEMPRRPENQGKVIIFEDDKKKLRKHLVSELPYPFTDVKDYEASIRAPVSRAFVPMSIHTRLIHPTISTKLGQVIQPMDEDALVKKPKKSLKRRTDRKVDGKRNTAKNIKRRKPNVTKQ